MRPRSKSLVRVSYNYGRFKIYGWADESTTREVHGIVRRDQPIRREIFVRWDHTFPPGYINVRNIVRCNP